jgi:plasmid maintenance system antidote protein VapI
MSSSPTLTPAKIRAALAERRILRWKFAVRVGVNPYTLSAILNERTALTEAMARRIAEALREDDERRAG